MDNRTKNTDVQIDLNEFESHISLYRILGQPKAVCLLTTVIECIQVNIYDQIQGRLPVILIEGELGTGKKLISKAFSNSMCADYEYVLARHASNGGGTGTLWLNSDKFTVYYIFPAEKLLGYSISNLYEILDKGFVTFKNPISREKEVVTRRNKIIIFGSINSQHIDPSLYDLIDYRVKLREYCEMDVSRIIQQRLEFMRIGYEGNIVSELSRCSRDFAQKAIELLKISIAFMRSDHRFRLTESDIQNALKLYFEEKNK